VLAAMARRAGTRGSQPGARFWTAALDLL